MSDAQVVWVVSEEDGECGEWVEALYTTKELAEAHAADRVARAERAQDGPIPRMMVVNMTLLNALEPDDV